MAAPKILCDTAGMDRRTWLAARAHGPDGSIPIAIGGSVLPTAPRVVVKLALVPLIVGLGYELIKLAGRHDNLFTKIISAPGMWLQHVTVFEPTDDMIECAIAAVKRVIPDDGSDKW